MEGTGGRYDGPLYSLSCVEHYLRDLSCVQKTNQVTTTDLPPRSGPRRSLDQDESLQLLGCAGLRAVGQRSFETSWSLNLCCIRRLDVPIGVPPDRLTSSDVENGFVIDQPVERQTYLVVNTFLRYFAEVVQQSLEMMIGETAVHKGTGWI